MAGVFIPDGRLAPSATVLVPPADALRTLPAPRLQPALPHPRGQSHLALDTHRQIPTTGKRDTTSAFTVCNHLHGAPARTATVASPGPGIILTDENRLHHLPGAGPQPPQHTQVIASDGKHGCLRPSTAHQAFRGACARLRGTRSTAALVRHSRQQLPPAHEGEWVHAAAGGLAVHSVSRRAAHAPQNAPPAWTVGHPRKLLGHQLLAPLASSG